MIECPVIRQPSTRRYGTHGVGNKSASNFLWMFFKAEKYATPNALLFGMTLALGILLTVKPVMADEDCDQLDGTATSQITGENTASGTASFTLGGRSFTATVTISAIVINPPGPDGISETTSSHTFKVKRMNDSVGTFTTADHGRLVPTSTPGVSVLQNSLTIMRGTVMFGGDSGVIETASILNPPTVSSVFFGTICH